MLASPLALTSRAVYVPNRTADSRARVEPRTTATMRRRFAAAAARRAVSMARGALVGECRASRLAGTSTAALACAARSIAGSSASPRARFAPRARAPSVPFARRGLAAVASPDTRAPPAAVGNGATDVAFADLDLCAETLRALHEVKGFERATAVQGQTLPHILGGADVLARAKTGSGKTIAFLLPALEKLAAGKIDAKGDRISVLILSPTRELATQILDETNALLRFHHGVGAQVVYGGTNIRREARDLRDERCDVLVATPGRLIDHLENGDVARRLEGCHTLVLDEADRLLDMGFKPSVEKILSYVPQKGRQTLLFSATVSKDIQAIARASLRAGHAFVDCVGEEASGTTNAQVSQALLIAPLEEQFAQLKRVVDEHCTANPGRHKIMVFFTTARGTSLAAELFVNMRDDVIEIHSKLSQSARTKATDRFRAARSAVIMTSDVTARGVDFDDVTLVVQMGVPSNREQYIHRLGRTGRAGKTGEGVLVLSPEESFFAEKDIADLPLVALKDRASPEDARAVQDAMALVDDKTKAQTYSAWLGFYKPFCRKMNLTPAELVRTANFFATDVLGCDEVPGLMKKTVGMMGLKGVPGLNIVAALPDYDGKARSGGARPASRPKDRDPRSVEPLEPRAGRGGGRGGGGRGGGGRGGRGRGEFSTRDRESSRERGEPQPRGVGVPRRGVARRRFSSESEARGGGRGGGRGERAGGRGGRGRGASAGRAQRERDFQNAEYGGY